MTAIERNPRDGGRPQAPFKPDSTVWEPDSLKKARSMGKSIGLTDEQARREQRKNKGEQVR